MFHLQTSSQLPVPNTLSKLFTGMNRYYLFPMGTIALIPLIQPFAITQKNTVYYESRFHAQN